MFTIKFYNDDNGYNVLSAPHYSVNTFHTDEGYVTEITMYKDMTTQNGVTYRVANELSVPHWKSAFVENSSGKTIDHIRY